jgi:hypothetical protein
VLDAVAVRPGSQVRRSRNKPQPAPAEYLPHEFRKPLLNPTLQRRRARSVSGHIQNKANSKFPTGIRVR